MSKIHLTKGKTFMLKTTKHCQKPNKGKDNHVHSLEELILFKMTIVSN
jgi:hypothetical protein